MESPCYLPSLVGCSRSVRVCFTTMRATTFPTAPFVDFTKLRRKSRLSVCEVITYTDEQRRTITIHYRVIDACPNAQTDVSRDCYTIEMATYHGRKVNLSGRGEQTLLEWLNETNPASVA